MRPSPFVSPLLLAALACPLMAADAGVAVATKDGVPGGVIVKAVEATGEVTAIDLATRSVTVRGEGGRVLAFKAGPEAVNLPQVKVGDRVRLRLVEQLIVAMADPAAKDGSAATVVLAPEGAKPGGVAAQTSRVTATIEAIDAGKRTATLRFPDGSSRVFPVRPDIDLAQRKAGESVSFTITEAIALSVEKP